MNSLARKFVASALIIGAANSAFAQIAMANPEPAMPKGEFSPNTT